MTTQRLRRPLLRPMTGRDPDERHRASTQLELLFDLCFVLAVAYAATGLHEFVEEHHAATGVLRFAVVFFAIWWAWVNFTWFASAYDNDDVVYRLLVLVQIAGCLILAAGVPAVMAGTDFTVLTIGYAVMRVGTVIQWLRAAAGDPDHRTTDLRYAAGVLVVQVLWLARLALPDGGGLGVFFVLAALDLLVPVVAERSGLTPWHAGHVVERYGLFTIIVLGESVTAATVAFQSAFTDRGHHGLGLAALAACGLVILFALWWLYFDCEPEDQLTGLTAALRWGYGHYFVFASIAAVGAGLQIAVMHDRGDGELSDLAAGYAIALPVAVFLLGVWLVVVLPGVRSVARTAFPATAALVLLAPLTGAGVSVVAGLLVLLVAVTGVRARSEVAGTG